MADVLDLFEEYAAAYARGEQPRASEFLARAGGDADELGRLLDGFLRRVPAPEPDEEALAATTVLLSHDPPLVALRNSRGIRVDQVVDALVTDLALDPGKRSKVKRLYQRLENGLLDLEAVSEKVWKVVNAVLGSHARDAARWSAGTVGAAEPTYFRAAAPAPASAAPLFRPAAEREQPDEIDRLFGLA